MKHGRGLRQTNTETRSFGSQSEFAVFGPVVDEAVRESSNPFKRRPMHDEGARCERFPSGRSFCLFAPEFSKVSGHVEEMGCKGQAGCRWMDDVCHDDRVIVPDRIG
jgi:hypothetical protein